VKYRLIQQWAERATPVAQACRVLEVSRAGYYQYRQRPSRPIAEARAGAALRAQFEASGRSYGSRRLQRALHQLGHAMGRYRVRRLMREAGLKPIWRRKFVHTTDSKHDFPVAENLLNQQFQVDQPNRVWVADLTYIRTRQGWLYLAAVMDLYSRKIVGWSTAASMPTALVRSALQIALQQRQPPQGLLLHSDRGSQYASGAYQDLLREHGIQCSMSRKGNCWDNAVMERFFLNLKMERVWQRDYANRAEAQRDIAHYIVGFYNSRRLHSSLGYLSPVDYELQNFTQPPIGVSAIT